MQFRTQPLGRAASYAAVSAFAKAEMREEVLRGYIYPSRNRFNEQFKERAKDTPLFNNQLRSRNLQAQLNMIDHTIIAVPEDKFKECLNLYVKAFRASWIPDEFGEYTAGRGSKLDSSIEDYTLADLWVKGVKEGVTKTHLALRAKDRAAVDAFHAAALLAGGKDNGAPGLRAYHASYYAAFVTDAAGNNIEVVCHNP
ncbi:hypothetical protein CCMA1212_000069 [Trichoderma ghanense]|uniref:VOC domain-containing protein n=1 Tax=Trichoderma ghanense TaxID=65468 RepID=A0ABY2HGM2_9HYPO